MRAHLTLAHTTGHTLNSVTLGHKYIAHIVHTRGTAWSQQTLPQGITSYCINDKYSLVNNKSHVSSILGQTWDPKCEVHTASGHNIDNLDFQKVVSSYNVGFCLLVETIFFFVVVFFSVFMASLNRSPLHDSSFHTRNAEESLIGGHTHKRKRKEGETECQPGRSNIAMEVLDCWSIVNEYKGMRALNRHFKSRLAHTQNGQPLSTYTPSAPVPLHNVGLWKHNTITDSKGFALCWMLPQLFLESVVQNHKL